jgi:hypothetical protein
VKLVARKSILVLLMAMAAVGWSWRRQQDISLARKARANAQLEFVQLEKEKAAAREQLTALERELGVVRSERDALLATASDSSFEVASRNRSAQWTRPPEQWPDWNAASPYVWLPKRALKRMQAPVWNDTDRLRDEIVALLGIESEARGTIDETVRRIMAEWRSAETAVATLSPDHLPNLGGKGEAVTVRVQSQPELAVRLRRELHALLEQQLGEQRAGLFEHFVEWWLDGELGPEKVPPTGPKIYSVRREGKLYHVATKGWSGSMGTSGNWRDNIPAHLHPIFAEALKQH